MHHLKDFERIVLMKDYIFPAEYEKHIGTIMIWPIRPGSWGKNPKAAQEAFCNIFKEILKSEDLYLIVNDDLQEKDLNYIYDRAGVDVDSKKSKEGFKLHILNIDTDDAWARDTGPTFIVDCFGKKRAGISWNFNAWGGNFDGLYASWEKDNEVAEKVCEYLGETCVDAAPFVLEGGSIHSDGEGTLMVTESCLLSKGRNPNLTKEKIEKILCEYLGIEKVLWLPRGIYNDETNEHVDNVAAFVGPAEIVLAWTDDEMDPQYELSKQDFEYLSNSTDAKGRKLIIHKLPIPQKPILVTEKDLENLVFEEGEDEREVGERLAASYVNFYFTNEAVLVPQFEGENKESDALAVSILEKVCKGRKVVPIYARDILMGGGNIHCITQQIPDFKR